MLCPGIAGELATPLGEACFWVWYGIGHGFFVLETVRGEAIAYYWSRYT